MIERTGAFAAAIAVAALLASLPMVGARAEDGTLKEDAKEVGHSVEKTAKKVGHATAHGARKAAKATAHGVGKAAHGVEHAAEKTEAKISRSDAAAQKSEH